MPVHPLWASIVPVTNGLITGSMKTPRKAVALLSGGLDSMLAARLILEQGIPVEGINFFTGFCVEGHTHAIRNHHQQKPNRNNALWVAEQLGIKLHIIDVIEEYKMSSSTPSTVMALISILVSIASRSWLERRDNGWSSTPLTLSLPAK